MYISYQALQSIHRDTVNDGLRRSARRRMLKDLEKKTDTRRRAWNGVAALTVLVRSIRGAVARPWQPPSSRRASDLLVAEDSRCHSIEPNWARH